MKRIYKYGLSLLLATSIAMATSLSTTEAEYTISETISVNIDGDLSGNQDWVGIYSPGTSNSWSNVLAWTWVDGTVSGLNIDTIKNEFGLSFGGNLEARLFFNNSYAVEASAQFYVIKPDFPALLIENPIYNEGDTPKVLVNTKLSGNKDWVGIYPQNSSNSWNNVIAWSWVPSNGTVTIDTVKKDMPAGNYEARLFYNNSYSLEDKTSFTVGENLVYPPEVTFSKKIVDRVDRPAEKFSSYIDTAFDTTVKRTVTRLTNREQDNKGFNNHQYPKQGSAWNSDMSLLRLQGRVYDSETLLEIPLTKDKTGGEVYSLMKEPQSGASGIRWSKHNANVLYVMSAEKKFYKLTISADKTTITEEVIIDLSASARPYFNIGQNEGNIDYEDRYVVLTSIDGNDVYAALVDIQAKNLVWGVQKLTFTKGGFDWMSISPSGNYILISANRTIRLYNRNLDFIRVLSNRAEHADIGYDQNGNEMYVQMHSGGVGIFGFVLNDTPQYQEPIKLLDSNHGGGHISCRNYKRKGWCYVGTREDGYREIFALKLDGSKTVQRFAKTNARGSEDPILGDENNYYYSTHPTAVPSPDGTRALFWSDYGNPEGYLYVHNGKTTSHYHKRDTYQVQITK